MQWKDMYLAGTGASLAPPVPIRQAVREGRYDAAEADRSGQRAVRVAPDDARSPDYAVEAGRQALRNSGHGPEDIAMLLYAVTLHDGVDVALAAAYVQAGIRAADCLPLQIRGACAGGLASIEVACAYLLVRPEPIAIVTSSDIWKPYPVIDRYTTSEVVVLGDGGAAVAIARGSGFARLLSTVTKCDYVLEPACRGDEPFGAFRHNADNPVDLKRRAVAFREEIGSDEIRARSLQASHSVVARALDEAGIKPKDVTHVITPFVSRPMHEAACLRPFGFRAEQTPWEYGSSVGHLGPADQFAGLHHLAETQRLGEGDIGLLFGTGADCMWSATVFEICDQPRTDA